MDYFNCPKGQDTRPASEFEQHVLDSLETHLDGEEELKVYYRLPLDDRKGERYSTGPDFVVLHAKQGLLLVDCFNYSIEEIEDPEGFTWTVDGSVDKSPSKKAQDKMVDIRSRLKEDAKLLDEAGRVRFPNEYFIALPEITSMEWLGKFSEVEENVLFKDDLEPTSESFRYNLPTEREEPLDEGDFDSVHSVLNHGDVISNSRTTEKRGNLGDDGADTRSEPATRPRIVGTPETKRDWLDLVEKGIKQLDRKQQKIGYQIPDGPQQIRGIAGSGKTVVCSMKAAKMHFEHPEWTIGLTFRNRSLHQRVRTLVDQFYAKFTNDAKPNWDNLHILHGWGGETTNPGMYYNVASATEGIGPKGVRDAMEEFEPGLSPGEQLERCCQELLDDYDIARIYDAIIIDEAQDFQHAFYRMCYKALVEPKRLTWAYDEAQNLATLSAPSAVDIFGRNPDGSLTVDVSTKYEGGANATHVMRNSYRTPRQVLMTAHALGMGLYREGGIIQTLSNQKNWRDIGYQILSGDFRPGSIGEPVAITRPPKHSPHPLSGSKGPDDLIAFEQFDGRGAELEWIAKQIQTDIEEGLQPDDILVIGLWPHADHGEHTDRLAEKIDDAVDIPSLPEDESACHFALKGSTDEFRRDGKITISNLRMARGNQAGMVYVAGLEQIAEERWSEYDAAHDTWHDDYVMVRNEAFVALTRSKAWCTVTGTGAPDGIFDELEKILDATAPPDPILRFETPNPDDLHKELSITETNPGDPDDFW